MFGSLLSAAVKVATLPLDVVDVAADVVFTGGDGSKRSRKQNDTPLTMLTDIRDGVAKACEDLDS